MKTYSIKTNDALAEAVAEIYSILCTRAKNGSAVVVGLSGDLGTGKTTLVQTLARQMGVVETVTSPTFTIMKRYTVVPPPFHSLVHIDAYRLESPDELVVLGFPELVAEEGTLLCVEWPERVSRLMPEHTVMLTLALRGEDDRTLILSYAENH